MKKINTYFISICIPAYNRTQYLHRLLQSVRIQTYKEFEVVLTDDSPGDDVLNLCKEYEGALPLRYFKNAVALGTPENWNEAIRRAKGPWIKIMHDDDWFASADSLQAFADHVQRRGAHFIFSAYYNVYEKDNRTETITLSRKDLAQIQKNPYHLYRSNFIGNPSCTLFKKQHDISFDKRLKWVVDFEFYIRYLILHPAVAYISQPLVNVGMNPTQVTTYTFRVAAVEVPENHLMLEKQGFGHLKNIFVYDYFWRLYRNLNIRKPEQVKASGYEKNLPYVLEKMISWQARIPRKLLRFGPFSKLVMAIHYLFYHTGAK